MNENVNVCITPKGDKPILHFSQFDNGRIFTVTVLADDGESAAVLTDLDIEFRLRKTDSHVVTVAPEAVADNVITFKTTEQMCACCGQNIASVVLMEDDLVVSTLDILIDIQRDILSGGLTSESDIRNLTTQIEQIVPEVIGDDYYTKTEVDELIADIPTFDPSNYYDKSDVDGLLADKANADDVYTKSDVDGLLADKADADDVMTKVTRHGIVGDVTSYTFPNNCVSPMYTIECYVNFVQAGSGTPSPYNPRLITGQTSCTITVSDSDDTPVNTCTVSFGQTVYRGVADITNGKVTLTHGFITFDGSENWYYTSSLNRVYVLVADAVKDITTPIYSNIIAFNSGYTQSDYTGHINPQGNFEIFAPLSITDVDSWKAWVSNNNIQLVYELTTPVEITFTHATTDTINGTNKVSSSTGNMKSVTYFSDVNSDLVDLIRACMI